MQIKFYDTCSLLLANDSIFSEYFLISSITLEELENIKTSSNKDAEVKAMARYLLRQLETYNDYAVVIYKESYSKYIQEKDFSITNDTKILATAFDYSLQHPEEEIIFVTNDLCLKNIAKLFFAQVESLPEDEDDDYDGYLELTMDEAEMTKFYSHQNENLYNLLINQYLVIKNVDGEIVDRLCWTGIGYRRLCYDNFNSNFFGNVKPMKGDIYQSLAADSLSNNKITMLKGPAGSGKTYLSLGFLMHKLEKNRIDKIIIFCNTVATKSSAKLGYYPGTRDEKLLDSQIGNLLISKFGGRIEIERMIAEEKLILLPLSDIRGYDTSGMKAGIYISEAQNLDINLMKLTLQRIGEDSICIIDGDCKTQVDDIQFAGRNNGMRRASKVFRNNDIYGEVTLKNIHRSKIAQIAENM